MHLRIFDETMRGLLPMNIRKLSVGGNGKPSEGFFVLHQKKYIFLSERLVFWMRIRENRYHGVTIQSVGNGCPESVGTIQKGV